MPSHVDREFRSSHRGETSARGADLDAAVTGRNQAKFFRRPLGAARRGMVPVPPSIPRGGGRRSKQVDGSALGGGGDDDDDDARASNDENEDAAVDDADEDSKTTTTKTSVTVGTQSDYRENDAQTMPYAPDYVIPANPSAKQRYLSALNHTRNGEPEILSLTHLEYGGIDFLRGRDVGPEHLGLAYRVKQLEVEHVERLRAKRAFEASLPPLDDIDQLPLRQRLMEEWEEAEWAERANEIERLQEERLDNIHRAIVERETRAEKIAEERIARVRAGKLAEKQRKFESIQRKRVVALRKLGRARDDARVTPEAPSVIDEYANFASTKYAPLRRLGQHPDGAGPPPRPRRKNAASQNDGGSIAQNLPFSLSRAAAETGFYQPRTVSDADALLSSLPRGALDPDATVARVTRETSDLAATMAKDPHERRREAKLAEELDRVYETLEASKALNGGRRGVGAMWPAPVKAADKEAGAALVSSAAAKQKAGDAAAARAAAAAAASSKVERPETPTLPPPGGDPIAAERRRAALLLQRLIRGRAEQNEMFAGKDKRFELIRELQVAEEDEATHRAKKITEEERAAIADANDRTGRAGAGMLGLLTEKNHGVTQLILMQTDLATRRREERALNYAAARIQAVCRGRATRKAEARRRAEEEASGGLPDIASFEPEEIAHVTRIQSSFRGRSSRRNMRLYGTPSKPKDLSKDLKEPSTPPIPPPPPANKEPAAEPATPPRAPAPKEPEEEDLDPLANLSAEDLEKVMAMQSSAKKIVDKKSLESELGEPLATLPADALGSSPSALVSAATLQRAATARLDDVPAQPRVRGARGLASAILLQSAAAMRAREVDADAAFEAKMDAALEEPLEAEKAKEKMPENDASASIESIEDSAAFRCVLYTGPHTTALAWWTPILKDFCRRFSPPTPRFQSPSSKPFNSI